MTDREGGSIRAAAKHLPELAAAGAGALGGWYTGDVGGAVIGGMGGPALMAVYDAGKTVVAARFGRAADAVTIAGSRLGLTPDEVLRRASEDAVRLELLGRVLEAAGGTTLRAKVVALGHMLAVGLEEDADADAVALLIRPLAALESPHIKVLSAVVQISGRARDDALPPAANVQATTADPLEILHLHPTLGAVLSGILQTLEGEGCICVADTGGTAARPGPLYRGTPVGIAVLDLLNDEERTDTSGT